MEVNSTATPAIFTRPMYYLKSTIGRNMQVTKYPFNNSTLCWLFAAFIFTGSHAIAQQQDAGSKGFNSLIEEVVVTARKREESLQDAPLSVSAYTGESLEIRGIVNISDVGSLSPNMTFQNNPQAGGSSSVATVYIRGVGQRDFLGTIDNGVGFYIDDVYISRTVGAIVDLVDVERVEILRGPQGTLFGRNSVGGTVAIHSKKPETEFGGHVSVGVGTDSQRIVQASIDMPVSQTFRTKFAVQSNTRNGYVNRPAGRDLGDDDVTSFRAGILWDASDDVEVRINADYSDEDENGPAFFLADVDVVGQFGNGFPGFYNNVTAGVTCAYPGGISSANPACYNTQWVNSDNLGTAPTYSQTEVWGVSLAVDWSINDNLNFKSITATRDLDAKFARDADASPITIVHFFDDFQSEQFSQEFQLLGSTDRLDWIVGLYYFEEDGFNQNILDFAIANFDSRNVFETESQAIFTQGTFHLTDQLDLTVGLRYTDEEKTFNPDQRVVTSNIGVPAGALILPLGKNTANADEMSPLVNLAYNLNENTLLYASYSEGFRSGGFVQRIFPPQPSVSSFDPEFVTSYELGFKYNNADGSLSLSGAVFLMDYEDIQVRVPSGVAQIERNVGEAEVSGAEVELKWQPAASWFVEASIGYTDASFDSIDIDTIGLPNPAALDDPFATIQVGNDFDHVPEWSASANVIKQILLEENGSLSIRVGGSYHTGYFNEPLNLPQVQTPEIAIWNANLLWTSASEELSVNVGIRNLTDEEYLTTGYFNPTIGTIEHLKDRGRTWSLTGKYSF